MTRKTVAIATPDKHSDFHTTPCNGKLTRDFAGNRTCSKCGFHWDTYGWRDELADRRLRAKGQNNG